MEDEVATVLENHNLDTEPRPQTETAEFAQLSNAVDQKVTEPNGLGSADGPPANQEQPKTSRALSSIDDAQLVEGEGSAAAGMAAGKTQNLPATGAGLLVLGEDNE